LPSRARATNPKTIANSLTNVWNCPKDESPGNMMVSFRKPRFGREVASSRTWGLSSATSSGPQTAGDIQVPPGDPLRIGRCQKHRSRRDVFRLADAAERSLGFDLLAKVTLCDPGRVKSFGLDHSGVDRIDANLTRAQFLGERACDRVHRRLGATVDRRIRQ